MLNIDELKNSFESPNLKIVSRTTLYNDCTSSLVINLFIYNLECECHMCYSSIYIYSFFTEYEIVNANYNYDLFNDIELDYAKESLYRIEKYINEHLPAFTKRKRD